MRLNAALRIGAAVALAIAGALVVAPAASADNVWFQSVGRASAIAACPDASFGSPWQSNWSATEQTWRPSWGQWMNGGAGGFTCDRQITWAKNGVPAHPSAGCLQYGVGSYVDFGGGWAVGMGAEYSDAACTVAIGGDGWYGVVYAPSPWDVNALCHEAFGEQIVEPPRYINADIWYCMGAG